MVRVRVPVEFNQYWICVDDLAEDDTRATDFAPGLAQWQPGEVIVTTADEDRGIDVEVTILDGPPETLAEDGWQDIAEFSLETLDGRIYLTPLVNAPRGPNLASCGAGTYRLRLAATDRDRADSHEPHERHWLQVWPAPAAPPALIKISSAFAIDWAASPSAPWHVDWPALAQTPGLRLIAGWRNLHRPTNPHLLAPVSVSVTDVLEGTPTHVYERFHSASIGGLASGMLSSDERGGRLRFDGFITRETYEAQWGEPPPASFNWVGNLQVRTEVLDSQRFHALKLGFGFAEDFAIAVERRTTHPLAPGCTELDLGFAKHPLGRQVTLTHRGVPRWLADDVSALWTFVLAQNRRDSEYKARMPWD